MIIKPLNRYSGEGVLRTYLAGVDIIGEKVVQINVPSPAGILEIN